MKKFLKKVVIDGGLQEQIAVQDATLGKAIKVFISLGPNGGLESFRQGFLIFNQMKWIVDLAIEANIPKS